MAKELSPTAYILEDKTNKRIYVGSTNNPRQRFLTHARELEKGIHKNGHLQNAYSAGHEFHFHQKPMESREAAYDAEQAVIDAFIDTGFLYNSARDARYCNQGKPHTEEHKRKISEANKGRQPFLGKTHSEETREKMSAWQIGKKLSPETVQKIREKAQARGFPEATRLAALKANTGCKRTAEQIENATAPNRKPVMADGTIYASLSDSARAHGISGATALNRIRTDNPLFSGWSYINA